MDYPHVRDSQVCPLCNNIKAVGLIVCWPCYQAHDIRNGLKPYAVAILEHAETTLPDNRT